MLEPFARHLQMICIGLALSLPLISQSASTVQNGGYRLVAYPSDSFSLTLPNGWVEIEPRAVAELVSAAKKAAPNLPDVSFKYGFKTAAAADFPRVLITLSDDHLSDETFANLNGPHQTLDAYLADQLDKAAGGTLQRARMSNLYYDKTHHVVWGTAHLSYSDTGDIQTLSAAYITKVGTIQIHCASKASEYEKYQPVFRQLIGSVVIDPKVALSAQR